MTTPEFPKPEDDFESLSRGLEVTAMDAFLSAQDAIERTDYVKKPQEAAAKVSRVLHWLLEVVGDKDSKDEYSVYSAINNDGYPGCKGEELPDSLKPLVTYVNSDELFYHDNNEIRSWTSTDYFENQPLVIPGWDDLVETYASYSEIFDIISNDQAIVDGIQLPHVILVPDVNIEFRPAFHYG